MMNCYQNDGIYARYSEPKPVSDSRTMLGYRTLPEDANAAGLLHGGAIMKFVDEASIVCGMRHCRNLLVTASIDKLNFIASSCPGVLLTVKASVNYVGKTSLEVGVRVETEELGSGKIIHVASGYMTLVSLDENFKPCPVPALILETDEDRRRHADAIKRRELSKMLRSGK